jgi:NAD(P)-dependent dehydrogenase (short-subunit alcohol dehydrogenase family)
MKIAIITGAGSGIGRACAQNFSLNGWQTILIGRRKNLLQETAASIKGTNILPCDLSNDADIERAVGEIQQICKTQGAQFVSLVNNAGIFRQEVATESQISVWREQFATNLFGSVQLTHLLLPLMIEMKCGSIVNVSSTRGLRPSADTAAYSASKAAMNNWTQALALGLGQYHIRVNCICPGLVDTRIHSFHTQAEKEKQKTLDKLASLQPLGRIGTPEDIARAVQFLAGEQSSWTTGAILTVDGGIQLK